MKRIRLVFSLLASFFAAYSQPAGWEHLDIQHDHFFGMSTTKAFRELLQGKKASDVLVAVIDGGIDTAHPALRPVLWTNQREIPGNGIDDDGNGYIDDMHGWSFTNFPVARQRLAEIIREKKDFFDSLSYTGVPPQLRRDYQEYRRLLAIYDLSARQIQGALSRLENLAKQLDTLAAATGKPNPTTMDFERLKEDSGRDRKMLDALLRQMKGYADFRTFYDATITQKKIRLAYGLAHLTTKEDSGHIAASFIENNADVSYDAAFSSLNNQSMESITYQPLACHGTHVAGIIAASGGGSSDVRGVAEHVKIMCLKVVSSLYSNCSEQVLADAIRYAVDNGARIINLSLGAPAFSGKKPLDSAIKYAMQKNVLIIHAAGNNGIDLDKENTAISFSKTYSDGSGQAEAWIEVGASGWKDSIGLAAVFSNYGKNTVDVFAPGDSITSTIPGRTYDSYSGTSMAAPMVAGLAALIMEYYPRLTALQVRDIILHSVAPVKHTVELPGSMERQHRVPFSELCATGGIVNAYNALKLASHYSGVNK